MVDTPIGTNSPNYTLVSGDIDATIFCRVTATNASGSAQAFSNTVGPVAAAGGDTLPANAGGANLPAITPTTTVEGTLYTTTNGTWTGSPSPTFTRQWKRGATNVGTGLTTYTTVAGDVGSNITCVVTATNTVGSANATSNSVGPVTSAPAHGAETTAWAAAVVTAGGTVSEGRKTLIDALIAGLKTDGVWTLLDRLWLQAAENAQSGLIDLTGAHASTPVIGGGGDPAFTIDRGFAGNGFNRIDTNFNPVDNGVNFTLNSACYFCYDRTAGAPAANTFQMGSRSIAAGVFLSELVIADDGTTGIFRVNDAGPNIAYSVTNSQGFWIVSRTGATALAVYKNGTSIATSSTAAVGVPDFTFWVGGVNADGVLSLSGSTDQIACVGMGAGLDATKAAALTTRIETYMDAIGAGII